MINPSSNLAEALRYASLGYSVFPCIETPGERSKAPYTRNGFHDATATDVELIRRWWNYKPGALIGLAIPDHWIVLDIDPRNGGSRAALEEKAGPLPLTLQSHTGRGDGGRHFFFFRPPGELTRSKLPPGVDLKEGGQGYVIIPPSRHPDSGRPYWWDNEDQEIAYPSYGLIELLRRDLSHAGRFVHIDSDKDNFAQLLNWLAETPEGSRNDYTFFAACRLAEKGALDDREGDLVSAALNTGLSEREIRTCIESARRRIG